MTTNARLLTIGGAVAATGGLLWMAKVAVIAATDGATEGAADAITGVLYMLAVALMAGGLATCAVALTAGRHGALRALAGLGGVVATFVLYALIDAVAKPAVGDAGPSWLPDEAGILVTGAVLAAAGLTAVRAAQAQFVPHGRL